MSILDSLKSLFAQQPGAGSAGDGHALWLYVRCKRCGAPLAVRVDLRNEPSPDYETGGYILRKEMMDSKCFSLMRAEIHMDAQHHITAQSIENGEFLSPDEYEELSRAPAAS